MKYRLYLKEEDKKTNDFKMKLEFTEPVVLEKCQYRNCNKDIEGRKKSSKFCCISHQRCEAKFRQRDNNKFKKEKQEIVDILINIKNISPEVIELYSKINEK